MGLSRRLESLTYKALDKLEEIIDEPALRHHDDYIPLTRIQSDASKTVVTAQVRTDEAKFRVRQGDQAQKILEMVLARKAQLGASEEQ